MYTVEIIIYLQVLLVWELGLSASLQDDVKQVAYE